MQQTAIPWDRWAIFLAVIETGSLSAAAERMGFSQPTLSRQIQRLEQDLALQLFQRTAQGLVPTAAAEPLVEPARAMQKAAQQIQLRAQGLHSQLSGSVRLSANEVVGTYLLPRHLVRFTQQYPDVHIEIVISNRVSSLSQREADLALRMVEPTQPDLIRRRLAPLALGFYAHRDYLARQGEPRQIADLQSHRLIGFESAFFYEASAQAFRMPVTPSWFQLRTDHMLTQLALARAGGGIVATHCGLANRWPEMQRVLPTTDLPSLPFYLLCHQDTRYNAVIRTLSDFLWQALRDDPYAEWVH